MEKEQEGYIRISIRSFESILLFKNIKDFSKIVFFKTYRDLRMNSISNAFENIFNVVSEMSPETQEDFNTLWQSCFEKTDK